MMEYADPRMKGRIVTVYNVVELEKFSPAPAIEGGADSTLRLLAAASFQKLKNPEGFIEAIAIAREMEPSLNIQLDWYGGLPARKSGLPDDDLWNDCSRLIKRRGLEAHVRLHPPDSGILDLYRKADAIVLPSFFEGLSNVVCEAMACGRPVLAGDVTDMANLVKDGCNGFLFDPSSPKDMARAVLQFAKLSRADRELFGQRGRLRAQRIFDASIIVGRYAEILEAAAMHKRVSFEHWISDVPDAAYRGLK